MEIKKSTIYLVLTILIAILAGYIFLQNGNTITGNAIVTQGEIQKITLGMKNYNYYPNKITVNSGSPVRMYLDESVAGCFRDLTIRELGIKKYLISPTDYLEFTPMEKGTYTFACSMGMGVGKMEVK